MVRRHLLDETCPRCGAALIHSERATGWRDWFYDGRRGMVDHHYRCPQCGLTGGHSTGPPMMLRHVRFDRARQAYRQARYRAMSYVRFQSINRPPVIWLKYLAVAEALALGLSALTRAPFRIMAWSVPAGGWLVFKLEDYRWDPSAYRIDEPLERGRDDLFAAESPFPLYVVPPESWPGRVFQGGWGSQGDELSHVDFEYVDRVSPRPERGFKVSNQSPAASPRPGPLFHEHAYISDVVNFLGRFAEIRRNAIAGFTGGPRRVMDAVDVPVAGEPRQMERVGFLEHPHALLYRVALEGVDVLLLAWGMSDEELRSMASRLERLEAGSDLLRRMQEADRSGRDRFRADHHGAGEDPPLTDPAGGA